MEPEVLKRGLKLDFNHHNLFYWLPPNRYFKDYPDWYPLVDGQRTPNRGSLPSAPATNEGSGQSSET